MQLSTLIQNLEALRKELGDVPVKLGQMDVGAFGIMHNGDGTYVQLNPVGKED